MRSTTICSALLVAALLCLAGCAATIQRESRNGPRRIEHASYTNVDVVLTDEGRRDAADNPVFNVRELGDYIRRRLEGHELLNPQGTHRVEVSIEHVRVRSMASAVILGFMAGADLIEGYVRVYDARGRQVYGYKVNASYALGGIAGGQDNMRMGWLYDKFSELAVAELAGETPQTAVAKGRAQPSDPARSPAVSITPAAAAAAVAITPAADRSAADAGQPSHIASGFAAIDDLDAIPYLSDRGRRDYSEWLKQATPRAFAIAPNGYYWYTSGLRPREASLPTDPVERALLLCERNAKRPCKLYAVNHSVVWKPEHPNTP
jgi:hypothetical protein